MDHTSDSYLFTELNESVYEDFAVNPPPDKIQGTTSAFRANFVLVRLGALHNFWWNVLRGEDGVKRKLQHPKKSGVTPHHFT